MNEWPLILWRFNCISTKEWNETRPSSLLEMLEMEILVSAFEICSGLFNKHQLLIVAKRRPSFL